MSELGNLQDVKIAEVLRVLVAGRKTGLVTVQDGSHQGQMQIHKGQIVYSASGRLLGREAVLDLFGWTKGQIGFVASEPVFPPNVSEPTPALIDEGARVGETFHRMQEVLTSDRLVFQWGGGPADGTRGLAVGGLEWRVLAAVDGIREVREVIELSRVPRADALRVLFEFIEAGFVERAEIPKALKVQAQGLFGKEAVEVDERNLLDWKKNPRFAHGVFRVDVRAASGAHAGLPVAFRGGLGREISLPRPALNELGVRDGDEVFVRPIA
jgi:hypothetical protein